MKYIFKRDVRFKIGEGTGHKVKGQFNKGEEYELTDAEVKEIKERGITEFEKVGK